ncbi:MAG TPA: protein kinase [Ktedonobacteraceae bacterium]|jgi:serine/threonine protein kinase/Rieske Fe-S protein|nr:protein kinase [Ktedonobacteraceae bacterium]
MQTEIVDQFVGQVVGKQGQYRVERLLGQSRLNAVYLARNLSSQQIVALTLFITPEHFSLDAYQRFIQRFVAAAPALVALEHPHILRVHEFGEQFGYPYLITPYLTGGSLADLLRKQKRFSYEEVLYWLEQIAPAIQHAHNRGQVHGTLKPTNLVLDSQQQVLVAGFGLMHILQLSGIVQTQQPFAHLLSLAETFLVAPEYLAPEVVEGRAIDKRSDVYALGCILFELLSGAPPFKGDDPLAVAQMHVQQQLPSLRSLVPDLPIALASVVHQALERDPQRRFQQVSDVLEAYSQVVAGVTSSRHTAVTGTGQTGAKTRNVPETSEEGHASGSWQLMPPIITGKLAAITPKQVTPPEPQSRQSSTGPIVASSQFAPSGITGQFSRLPQRKETSPLPERPVQPLRAAEPPAVNIVRESAPPPRREVREEYTPPIVRESAPPPRQEVRSRGVNMAEDAAWWTQQAAETPLLPAQPDIRKQKKTKSAQLPPARVSKKLSYGNTSQKRSSGPNRRQVLALVGAGGVVAAGAVVATNLHLFQHLGLSQQSAGAKTPGTQQTASTPASQQNATKAAATKPATNGKQPAHTGSVVGSTTLLINSAQQFANPADGKSSLLIHLPSGNFVAYKQACTHEGVSVNYDPNTHTLVCPAHGAIFDPAKSGAVLQGPATSPLPTVGIKVNGDGTVTTL